MFYFSAFLLVLFSLGPCSISYMSIVSTTVSDIPGVLLSWVVGGLTGFPLCRKHRGYGVSWAWMESSASLSWVPLGKWLTFPGPQHLPLKGSSTRCSESIYTLQYNRKHSAMPRILGCTIFLLPTSLWNIKLSPMTVKACLNSTRFWFGRKTSKQVMYCLFKKAFKWT